MSNKKLKVTKAEELDSDAKERFKRFLIGYLMLVDNTKVTFCVNEKDIGLLGFGSEELSKENFDLTLIHHSYKIANALGFTLEDFLKMFEDEKERIKNMFFDITKNHRDNNKEPIH